MRKIYRSKIDLVLLIPPVLILLTAFLYALIVGKYFVAFIFLVAIGFLLYLCRSTFYQFTNDNKLKVHSGFLFNREIYIHSIRKIRPAKDHSASPALSQDRLQIFYNRYGSVLISPQHSQEFIEELKKINPRINVVPRLTAN